MKRLIALLLIMVPPLLRCSSHSDKGEESKGISGFIIKKNDEKTDSHD
ncbi:hypothetical protein ACI7RC_27605 [Brevibacillus sp. B_LB10_24]